MIKFVNIRDESTELVTLRLGDQLLEHHNSSRSKSDFSVNEVLSLNKVALFSLGYVDPNRNITDQFLSHIEYCLQKCQSDNKIYAPYFCILSVFRIRKISID